MSLRLGFIGCGLIARSHARKLGEVAPTEAHIGSCFDIDAERAQTFADDHDCERLTAPDAVIERSDAVYVTTWTSAHADYVAAVVAAGKPVFCEKPLAPDLATAQEMVDLVRSAGVINQVGLILRSSPSFRWLHHQVHHGGHGDVMSMVFRDDQYLPIQGMYGSTWRGDVDKAGSGTLLEHSIHDIDLIDWIVGPVSSVSAMTANHHSLDGIEDQATVVLTTASGASVALTSTWHDVLSRPSQRLVEVFCREAYLALDGDWHGPMRLETSNRSSTVEAGEPAIDLAYGLDGVGTNPDLDFVRCVLEDRPAAPDFATALRAHVITDAAYRSAASGGMPIELVAD